MNSQTPREEMEVRLTALLLGELPAEEAAALRETIARDPELARLHDRLKLALELVREARPTPDLAEQAKPEPLTLAPERRTKLLKLFKQPAARIIKPPFPWRAHRRELLQLAAMGVGLLTVTGLVLFSTIRREEERYYKDLLEGQDFPRGPARIVSSIRRSIGWGSASSPRVVMDKLGDASESTITMQDPTPTGSLETGRGTVVVQSKAIADLALARTQSETVSRLLEDRHPHEYGSLRSTNSISASGASASQMAPQWIGGVGLITNSTVMIAPLPPSSGADTIRSMAREFDAKAADKNASKLPVVGLQIQDAERGEAAKRSLATIALPQSADAYGAVADSRGQAAFGLAPMAPAGQAGGGGLSGGAGGFGGGGVGALGKSAQTGALAAKKNESLIANNTWGLDTSYRLARPEPGVAAGVKVEAFDAPLPSRDAGGVWYANAPQGRPAENLERSAEARPGSQPGSGKEESLAVRELDERERVQTKGAVALGDLPVLGQLFRRDGKDEAAAVAGKPSSAGGASPAQLSAGDVLQVVTVPTEPPPVMGREIAQVKDVNRSVMSRPGAAPAGPATQPDAPTLGLQAGAVSEAGVAVKRMNGFTGGATVNFAAVPPPPPPAPPLPSVVAPLDLPAMKPTEHGAFLAPIPSVKSETDADGVAAVKARSSLSEVPAKGLSDLQRKYLFAEGQPAMPTAGQRPDELARFGAITAPTADDNLALGLRTDLEQRGRGVTPLAAAPQALKPEPQAEFFKIELPSAGEADKEAKEAGGAGERAANRFFGRYAYRVPQAEPPDLDKLQDQSKLAESKGRSLGDLAPKVATNGREVRPQADKAEVQKLDESLREEARQLEAKVAEATKSAAPAPQPRSSRRKEAQTSTAEIQDLKTETDQSLRTPAATERGRKVLQEAELRRKLSVEENEKLLAPAKPAAPPPIPQPEVSAAQSPFSTFSLNVSDVSFKLAAASLEKGVMPDLSTVRSEEFINAFDYHDPEPTGGAPIAFAWERARYPFAHDRDLLRFSVKTAASGRQPGRPLNLVLLLDNSGSMERADRVAIRAQCLRVLAGQLQAPDRVSVVAFARTARLWVDGLPGSQAGDLAKRVGGLTPEGGTNLEDALNLAYRTALRHFLPNGVNRVVLLTDGAANLGDVDPASLKQKVEAHRRQGVALDCFGIGWEGYNDDLLEVLSRNGDGRYGFVNTPEAAATEFAGQLAGALQVAASDVKVQVEWNPRRVTVWRQIGYAKHQLKKEQFRDNTVDAAEIAAAEAGNALYTARVNPAGEGPLGTVRVRFKAPGTSDYREHEWPLPYEGASKPLAAASPALRLAATGAAFSEWLASSPFAGEVTPDHLLGYLAGVPELYPADPRPKQLEWMIRQARSLGVR